MPASVIGDAADAARMADMNLGGMKNGRNRFRTRTWIGKAPMKVDNIRLVNMMGSRGVHFRDKTSLVAERTKNMRRDSCSLPTYVAECSTDRRDADCSAGTFDDGHGRALITRDLQLQIGKTLQGGMPVPDLSPKFNLGATFGVPEAFPI
ncbi:hypothetical protein K438DRAFT_1929528 [Mycena galopus ATCC 62051]|nr:hypothetical protein K438DRAFT_1929528 [Mycena galopus ATCC 62051]